ncbi:MAG TPA: hypothetical protein ENJ41_04020, partial [Oceanospirillales bacterium]|nr:hypothetical protein [Oceanospirillales bacterium]
MANYGNYVIENTGGQGFNPAEFDLKCNADKSLAHKAQIRYGEISQTWHGIQDFSNAEAKPFAHGGG